MSSNQTALPFNIFAWQRAIRDSNLCTGARAVAWTLATYANDGEAWPSREQLAEGSGLHKSTVTKHLRTIERAGLLKRQRRPNRSTVYLLAIPDPSTPAPNLNPEVAKDDLRKTRRSHNATSEGRITRGPEVVNREVRKSHNTTSLIRKNYPQETAQEEQPTRNNPTTPPTPSPAVVGGGGGSSGEVSVQEGQRSNIEARWAKALEEAYLQPVPLPEPLVRKLLEWDEERLESVLGSLNAGVRSPLAWISKIAQGKATAPPRAAKTKAGKPLWTSGRTLRVSVHAADQDDDPYRFSGKPSVWTPPGVDLPEEGGVP
ncbi:MAG: helix-turn-helix domain-containing protein [Myxococcota bacterium]